MRPNRNIDRIKYGWRVRFRKNKAGKSVTVREKIFKDADFRKEAADALLAAMECRDLFEKELCINGLFNESVRSNNKSGITGVFYTEYWRTTKVKGREYKFFRQHWMAAWCENKKLCLKKFPVSKYGYDEARRLAIDHRKKMESGLEKLTN